MRTLASSFRNAIEARYNGDAIVIFATVTHPDLASPLYFNSETINVNYVYGGNTFVAAAFHLTLVTDDEQTPQAKVSIHNVDQVIGNTLQGLATSPLIGIQLFAKSDFTDDIPRVAIATPTVEYSAPILYLRNVNCDAMMLSADLYSVDISTEPWPAIRATKDRVPGLFVR